ncbi:MAG: VirB4 family type IV secretion/conjugal transfer ATPase [Rickettsiaceae bacterium]|nr:VirB4 family type IV secretion/conjugal transfer ATPase [Rickettsiaceae bacterium]
MKFFKTRVDTEKYARKEKPVSDFIPYKCHWDRNTILTKNNELLQVIKVGGFSFETADDEDLEIRKNMRNLLFKNLSSGNISLYFHTIRQKRPLTSSKGYKIDPTIKIPSDFAIYVTNEWKKKYASFESYANDLYITIMYKPDKAGAAMLAYLYNKMRQSSDKKVWESDMREMKESLSEVSTMVLNTFRDFDSQLLGSVKTPYGTNCQILEFFSSILSCGNSAPMLAPRMDIDKYIPTSRLFFGSKAMECRGPLGNKYAGIVSIREYGPRTSAGVFDAFLQMPFEFIMTQSFVAENRTVAINKMQLQQNRMIQMEDKAVSQIQEISQALDMATGGQIGFGEHHITLMCIDDSLKSLENNMSTIAVELSNCGMQPVVERVNMEPSFWGQLPGNIDCIVRRCTINTLNLAGFVSMHNFPTGKADNNFWGEHVTILDTTSGTPYYFNFHVRDVGHSLIIGPTGAGKTVLMNFLCAQAQKFTPRMFFFDKDRGAEIFIRALGGVYTIVNPAEPCNFNPLQLDDTGENRTFLIEWMKILVTANGEDLSTEDIRTITQAVEGNFRLEKKDRRLSNIVAFLGIDGPGTLAGRISMWYGKGSRARIFDNETDNINLNKARIFGFEMAELLKDTTSLSPVLLYLFHRINMSLDGSRCMIVLDEAWALIDNPVFAPKIKDWLKVLRKLNTFVIFATQSVEDAAKSRISDTLIQQTATQIFLPNLKATEVYRTAFMLTQREYELIKTTDPSSRYFLIKQGLNAVIARLNLSGMDNIVNVLSGRTDTILLVQKLREEHGDDPEIWLPLFYEALAKR